MVKGFSGLMTALLGLGLFVAGIADAEARRMGGGSSFGSKPGYSAPFQRTTPPASKPAAAPQPSSPAAAPAGAAAMSPAAQQNASRQAALANRGGLMGALGGLALGGLLGALLFGGAFENLNLVDFVIFGLIAAALWWFFSMRRRAAAAAMTPVGAGAGAAIERGSPADADFGAERSAPAEYRTDGGSPLSDLNSEEMARKFGGAPGASYESVAASGYAPVEVPAGFDRAAFLAGAQRAYRMLQEAWDRADLADIRGLTTDATFGVLQDQLRERHGENRTEVLHLSAELLEVRENGAHLEATVLFDAFLREQDADTAPDARGQQVKEVWHFIRPVHSRQPKWLLDGIQQLA